MNTNPYEYLKTPFLGDCEPIDATATFTVTEGRDESVSVYTAITTDGFFCYGYQVIWANGRRSFLAPIASNGLFKTQREAKLHALGFFKVYLQYFTEDTQAAINKQEAKLLQMELF